MEAIIDKKGNLKINRARNGESEYRDVFCPYCVEDDKCGDWCVFFGEPEIIRNSGRTRLPLCRKDLMFEIFFDERKEDE
jgi:hypothetical protein